VKALSQDSKNKKQKNTSQILRPSKAEKVLSVEKLLYSKLSFAPFLKA